MIRQFNSMPQAARKALARKRKEYLAKHAKPIAQVEVSEELAEAIKTNPDSVRVSARASRDVTIVHRPRRTEVLEVLEVDDAGRPAQARRYDVMTGEWGMVEFQGGYRREPDARHEYDPLAALNRD